MKRILSIIILVIVLSFITGITIYTLNNKGIKEEVKEPVTKRIEMVTSNKSNNTLFEIYNVYLNNKRHKVKFEYNVSISEEEIAGINLVIYFDGKSILNEEVANNIKGNSINEVLEDENINSYVRLSANSIHILKEGKKEYFLLDIGYFDEVIREKYFVFNDNGDTLLEEGILVRDDSLYYVSSEGEELDIFYDINYQRLAKTEDNTIYSLEAVKIKKKLKLEEYTYTLKNGKLEKKLINTSDFIKLKEEKKETKK